MRSWFDLMLEHRDDLARLMTTEQGKPLAESLGEINYAAFLSRFPVRFEVGALNFRCATPAVDLRAQDRLVFRVTAPGSAAVTDPSCPRPV